MPSLHHSGPAPGDPFFAAYVGPSMNPTLREPEIMEIQPYARRPLRVGDVVFFVPPEADQPVVHRVVRVTSAGISTLGDNNTREDALLLQPQHIRGRVVAARCGHKRRTIAGGWPGRLTARWRRWQRALDRGVSPLLHPLYHGVSNRGWIARLMPAPLRPRVVVFRAQGREQFQLLLGRRVIGRYDDHRQQWQIQRPFHLLVDGRVLRTQAYRDRLNRHARATRQRTMTPSTPAGPPQELALKDGTRWSITAGDEAATALVSQLGRVMQMRAATGAPDLSSPRGPLRRLEVQVDAHTSVADCYVPRASGPADAVVCVLSPSEQWGGPHVNLVRLSLILAREAQARGGFLIHGALAERDGRGVILAAPGGTGKTTASHRLPAPWHSLCDDTTLVVRDPHGRFWAHPWPTWSRFLDGGPGGTWDVQSAVPLQGIFVLAQAAGDRVMRVGPGQAVSLLVESVRQASQFMPLGLFKEEVRALHLEGFNNLCALAQQVPVHTLHLSLTGTFWSEMEQALAGDRAAEPGR